VRDLKWFDTTTQRNEIEEATAAAADARKVQKAFSSKKSKEKKAFGCFFKTQNFFLMRSTCCVFCMFNEMR